MTGLPNQSKTTNYFCWISTRVVAHTPGMPLIPHVKCFPMSP
jgi:hypothetical protein